MLVQDLHVTGHSPLPHALGCQACEAHAGAIEATLVYQRPLHAAEFLLSHESPYLQNLLPAHAGGHGHSTTAVTSA